MEQLKLWRELRSPASPLHLVTAKVGLSLSPDTISLMMSGVALLEGLRYTWSLQPFAKQFL